MDPTQHISTDTRICPLGLVARVIYGFNACIPFLLILAIVVLGVVGRVIGLNGFLDFIEKNLRPYVVSIALSAISLALLFLLIKGRPVVLPIFLLTVSGILFQPVELANVSAVAGMPLSLFFLAESFLSRAGKWTWFSQILAFAGSLVAGAFFGVLILVLRQRLLT